MSNASDRPCTENENTHLIFNKFFFFPENRAVCEIMSKNIAAGQTNDDNKAHAHCMLAN